MEKPAKAVNIRHRKHISTFPVWVVFLCMLPGILHYTIFRLFPSVMTAVLSFTDISGIPGSSWQWVGWANYKEFFVLQNIRDLKASLGRTGIYALSVTLIQNALALLMAVILNGKFLNLLDEMPSIEGVEAFRLAFTTETPEEVSRVISAAQRKLDGREQASLFRKDTDTRGHYNKEII